MAVIKDLFDSTPEQPAAPAPAPSTKVVTGLFDEPAAPASSVEKPTEIKIEGPKGPTFHENVTNFIRGFTGTDDVGDEKEIGKALMSPEVRLSAADPKATPAPKDLLRELNARREVRALRNDPASGDLKVQAFMSGIIADPTAPPELSRAFPLQKMAGDITGLVGIGKVIAPMAGVIRGAQVFDKIPGLGAGLNAVARHAGANMAQSGSTFGIKSLVDNMSRIAGGDKEVGAKQVIGEAVSHTAFGAGLGAVGTIPAPLLRIPSEAAYGFATAKLQGADNINAGAQAVIFGMFGLLNRHNLTIAYKTSALNGLHDAVVDNMVARGFPESFAKEEASRFVNGVFNMVKDGKPIKPGDVYALAAELRKGGDIGISFPRAPQTTKTASQAEKPVNVKIEGPSKPEAKGEAPKKPATPPDQAISLTAQDLLDRPVSDLHARWEALQEAAGKQKAPILKAIADLQKELAGKKGKEKTPINKKIQELEAEAEAIDAVAEEDQMKVNEDLNAYIHEEAKKAGISEDELSDLVAQVELSIQERPGIESNWQTSVRDVIKDEIAAYGDLSPEDRELMAGGKEYFDAMKEKDAKAIYVPKEMMAQKTWEGGKHIGKQGAVEDSSSGHTVDSGKIQKPFEWEGKLYVKTGSVGYEARVSEVIPADQFTGKTYSKIQELHELWNKDEAKRGDMTGLKVSFRGKPYVIGAPAIFRPDDYKERVASDFKARKEREAKEAKLQEKLDNDTTLETALELAKNDYGVKYTYLNSQAQDIIKERAAELTVKQRNDIMADDAPYDYMLKGELKNLFSPKKKEPTQKEKVKEAVAKEPKPIKKVAEETGILEPNVRRILGVGEKQGTFKRVDKGVYILNDGAQDLAYIQAGDSVKVLPELVKKGLKVDMVFLDIPYNTAAVRGGNRGVKYDLISTADFKTVMEAIGQIVKTDDTPVYYMWSQAKSGVRQMLQYNKVLLDSGFKLIADGDFLKTDQAGKPQQMFGRVMEPEKIWLLNKSGNFQEKDLTRNLNFKLQRPEGGYQTEKPADLLRSLIQQGTKAGDTVLDPFAGSGVAPAEAVKAGRKAVAVEKSQKVVDEIIVPRVEKAVKEKKAKEVQGQIVENDQAGAVVPYTATPEIIDPKDYKTRILGPHTGDGNGRWYWEVRYRGWLMDVKRFDTQAEVDAWDAQYKPTGRMDSPEVARFYKSTFEKYAERERKATLAIFDSYLKKAPLPDSQRGAEQAEIDFIRNNLELAIETYNAASMVEYKTGVPNVLSADLARTMDIEGREPFDSTLSQVRHAASSALIKTILQLRLADPENAGKPFALMGGVSGAGKTSSLKALGIETEPYAAVVDTNTADPDSGASIIERVLKSDPDRKVVIIYIDRDPIVAFKQGVYKRFVDHPEHRIVPIPVHIKNAGAKKAMEELVTKYKGNERIEFIFVDNNGKDLTEAKFVESLEELPVKMYTQDGLRKHLEEWISEKHRTGEITEAQAKTFLNREVGEGVRGPAQIQAPERPLQEAPRKPRIIVKTAAIVYGRGGVEAVRIKKEILPEADVRHVEQYFAEPNTPDLITPNGVPVKFGGAVEDMPIDEIVGIQGFAHIDYHVPGHVRYTYKRTPAMDERVLDRLKRVDRGRIKSATVDFVDENGVIQDTLRNTGGSDLSPEEAAGRLKDVIQGDILLTEGGGSGEQDNTGVQDGGREGGVVPSESAGLAQDARPSDGGKVRRRKPARGQDTRIAPGNTDESGSEGQDTARGLLDAEKEPDTVLSVERPVELSKAQRRSLNEKAKEILAKPSEEITPADREVLRRYTGAGGLQQAEQGVLNQHYTSYQVIDWIWKKLARLGVSLDGVKALEAAEGVGNFLGFKPAGVEFDAVELDETASKIASILYPNQRHYNMPFEKFTPNRLYDISIGNDPFGNFRGDLRYDPAAADYKQISTIHDFFLTKRLDLLRPNGVMAVITSIGTMDKLDDSARRMMNKKAEFITAYRLPDGIFKKNTQYDGPADVLFFRKRTPEEIAAFKESDYQPEFVKSLGKGDSGFESILSTFFKEHPENAWGTLTGKRGQFGHQTGVVGGDDLADRMAKALEDGAALVPRDTKYTSEDEVIAEANKIAGDASTPYGGYKMSGGKLYVMGIGNELYEAQVQLGPGREKKVPVALDVLEKLDRLVGSKTFDAKLQKEIKGLVEGYRKAHGKSIGYDTIGLNVISTDPRYYRLAGLMTKDGELADILTKPTLYLPDREVAPANVDDIADVVRFIKESEGRYDFDKVKALYPGDAKSALMELPGMNLEGDKVVPDEEYLYGDIHQKIEAAEAAGLKNQAEKLKLVLPEQARFDQVEVSLLATYISNDLKTAWLNDIGIPARLTREVNPVSGVLEWDIQTDGYLNKWSGPEELRIGNNSPIEAILKYLNHEKEYEEVEAYTANGDRYAKKVMSPEKTAALKKVDELFSAWMKGQGAEAKAQITAKYNRLYRSFRRRAPESKAFQLKGLASSFYGKPLKIMPHQWEWIWQMVYEGRGIDAHGVGGGKTLAAIVLSQTRRQMGLQRRPLFVVPAKVIQNWAKEMSFLFPGSKIMSLENLDAKNANKMFQQIAMNEFDFALVSTDRLKIIPLKASEEFMKQDIAAYEDRIRRMNSQKGGGRGRKATERQLQEKIAKKKESLKALQDMKKTNTIFFEDMGFDSIYVDEAHNYKNVYLDWGTYTGEQGITTQNFSDRANDLDYKIRHLHKEGKKGTFFLTATPTPNNPIEIYAMLKYINPDVWTDLGIMNAGDFLDRFADIGNIDVVNVDGTSAPKNVVAGYKNLDELREIFKRYVDFRPVASMAELKRPDAKYNVVEVPISQEQMDIYGKIASEVDFVKSNSQKAKEQGISMLSLTTQGRQASVGADIWDAGTYENWFSPNSKLAKVTAGVADIFKKTGSGQLIFLDIYKGRRALTDGDRIAFKETGMLPERPVLVNYHERIRQILSKNGIPKDQIAIINGESNNTTKAKQAISEAYNTGKLKVVIGTTQSMGEGMNLQADTVAIHNVDVPWTPDALTQRNGRGVRQGNKNEIVDIYNYVTKGSLDAFMYDKLAKKDSWNKALWLSNEQRVSNINLDEDAGLSYEELSNSLTINPEVKKYWISKREYTMREGEIKDLQAKIDYNGELIEKRVQEVNDRSAKITEYEKEIEDRKREAQLNNEEPDLDGPTTRIEGHTSAIEELNRRIDEYRAEVQSLAAQKKGVEDKVEGARQIISEYEAKHNKPKTVSEVEQKIEQGSVSNAQALHSGIPFPTSKKKPVNDKLFAGEVKFSDPDTERRYREAHGLKPEAWTAKLREIMESVWHKATRVYEHLPNTPEYAELRNILSRQAKNKEIAQERTVRMLEGLTAGFGPKKLDVFTRKVILEDLSREAEAGRAIPFGYSYYDPKGKLVIEKDRLALDLETVNKVVTANPDIEAALLKREALWDAVRRDLVNYGVLKEEQLKEDYFRHQVLEYQQAKQRATQGTGQKLKTPNPAYAKRRHGSTFDINSSYVEAEFQVLSQALHDIETAKNIEQIEFSDLNIAQRLKDEAKAKSTPQNKVDWHELIPEGWTTWQPKEGRQFFTALSVPQRILNQILEDAAAEIEMPDLKKILAVGRMRKEFVVRQEVADTLDSLWVKKPENFITVISKKLTQGWKRWVLFNPRRAFKYNFQNFIGDFDAVVAGNPRILSHLKTAVGELTDVFYAGKPMTPAMREFFERGGLSASLTIQELPELKNLESFQRLYRPDTSITSDISTPLKALDAYWNAVTGFTNYRESVLRYAAYLYYKDLFVAGGKEYGASDPKEVDAIKDPLDRASKVATELLGDYHNVTAMGKDIRETLIPFYSWLEVNAKRYGQLIKNNFDESFQKGFKSTGYLAGMKGGAFLAKFWMKLVGLTAIVSLYNFLLHGDEEADLGPYDQNRMHIVLGRNAKGEVMILRGQGAFSDLLEWFGLNDAPQLFREYFEGKASLEDVFGNIPLVTGRIGLKPAVQKILRGINPFYKVTAELATGKTLPIWDERPQTIEDKNRHFLKMLQLENEYDALVKNPSRGYFRSLAEAFITTTDPEENAYRYIVSEKYKFLESKGIESGGADHYSARSILYRQYKRALRFGDADAEKAISKKMQELHVTYDQLQRSLESSNPLYKLKEGSGERAEFINRWLGTKDKEKLDRAMKYYRETFLVRGGNNARRTAEAGALPVA
jgi:N12 class adenine-specific DNA methylase